MMVNLASTSQEAQAPVMIHHDQLVTLWLQLNPQDRDSLKLSSLQCHQLVKLVVLQGPWGGPNVATLVCSTPLFQSAQVPNAVLSTSNLVAIQHSWPHLSTIRAAQWEGSNQLLSTAKLCACFMYSWLESLSLGPSLGVSNTMLQAIIRWSPHLHELVMDGLVAITTLKGLKSTSLHSLNLASFMGLKGQATLKGTECCFHVVSCHGK